ncbi:transcription antiterminator BglG [Mobilicoccus caccae]|uniref:Transcription antiterminator BglG n=2 Tax=Mobilicoccus caccae TaxID=1859295 RepID=A0ABQ6IKT6_9MICO|nr:transcription antiterminator BglG [Mobilicoccus caccae]
MEVVRALNNSAVLATSGSGERCVLMGKGIGWNKGLGDAVDMAAVTQRFVPDGSHSLPQLAAFLADIDLDIVLVAQSIVELAARRLGVAGEQPLLLTIADHIHHAQLRLGAEEGPHPLSWEIDQLYPEEAVIGREAAELVEQELGWALPQGEPTAFALHLVNARFATGDLAKSAQMTRRISEILDVVAARTGADIHADPMNVARFVAHLRYLLARMDEDRLIEDGSSRGLVDLRESHPEAHAAAEDLRSVFSAHGRAITADEVGYPSLHIARLTSAQRRS